ncbi:receptor-type tyrosine-protein phosphatase T-like [Lineus longissimus]|uniref:receptor-type tyrosine-protein phosphatase T-like n=1 Tax=Lineus longissimus TaxID=88925 RepID=UPI002B4EACFF
MERIIVCLAFLIGSMMITITADACPINTTFGDSCDYQCHCAGNVPCNPVNGSCPNGCADGWEGEYCQRGNAATGKSSDASQSSTNGMYSASRALDGRFDQNFPSCSHTQEEKQPWWQVDLGKDYVVFAVRIWNVRHVDGDNVSKCKKSDKGTEYRGTISTTIRHYNCKDWSLQTNHRPPPSANYCRNPSNEARPWCYTSNGPSEGWDWCNIPKCEERLSNFKISLDNHGCHHFTGIVANGGSPEIRCDSPVVGRHLKIQLLVSTFLTLCEVSVAAFQYRACQTKHYGPNCNNRCQCANDDKCDDKTGGCPIGICNDRFTGPYCNIEIPTCSEHSAATPTSISIQWPYIRPHDSPYDAVTELKYHVVYKQLSSGTTTLDIKEFPAGKGTMNANLTGLQPSTAYNIGLKIKYSFTGRTFGSSTGPKTTLQTGSCQDHMISPNVTVEANTIDMGKSFPFRARLSIKMEVTGMLADCIRWLDIYYKATRGTRFKRIRKADPIYTIETLSPYTEYEVNPSVVSPDGKVRNGTSIKIITAEDIPLAPSVRKSGASPTSISVTVVPPNPSYGVITQYILEMSEQWTDGVKKSTDLQPTDPSYTFKNLALKATYGFRAKASTSKGDGAWSEAIKIITEESIPGPPDTLEVTEQTTSSLKVVWTQPKYQSGILLDYKVTCTPLFSYDEKVNRDMAAYTKESNPGPSVNELEVSGLQPATEYNCSVAAQTSMGYGPCVWLRNWTKPEEAKVPANLFVSVSPDKTTDTTITVYITEMPDMLETGTVSKLYIAVEKVGGGRRKRSIPLREDEHNRLIDHDTAKEKGYTSYIAAELAADFSGPFVIGDGKTYGSYYNAPLEKGQSYDVIFGMAFTVGEMSTVAYRRYGRPIKVESKSNIGKVAGLAVGILVALAALIVLAVIIYRRKSHGKKQRESKPFDEDVQGIMKTKGDHEMDNLDLAAEPGPSTAGEVDSEGQEHSMPISGLIGYVKAIRGERAAEFTGEFESLPKNMVKSVEQAKEEANLPLNRYKNILAYDHSRVVLQPVGSQISDYINASFIHGYQGENAFIASQGPIPTTIPAMWRMIWQERCATVVMLTHFKEMGKPKCDQYWPDQGRTTYGPFTVQLAEEYKYTDYVKRILTVTLNEEVHTVKHFHFTSWPDHGVPKFACSMLNFRRQVFQETEYGKAPILVHCSAGAGRTGTFIGIDYLIRQGKAEKKVNFYECVLKMREQRPNMVQNVGQYAHVHDAILEFFKVGITYIQSAFYPEAYCNLIKPLPEQATCRLQQQYSIMKIFTDAIVPSDKAICHSSKNRNQYIVPDDMSRVVLSLPVSGWDDYVNAVYATGYGERDTYIITQMPLPETMKDIWRIVHDTGISTIVMMNVVDSELAPDYCPVERERLELGPLVVEGLATSTSNSDIVSRDFRISMMESKGDKGDMSGRLVRHFQLQNWPDGQPTPSSPESIVELLQMVEKWLQKVENKTILVQCLDGASQSGVFCAAHSVIEKVKVDHEVDVFQYLRLLRSNRPQLVNTYEQYKFIHEVVLEYLKGFETYANFL